MKVDEFFEKYPKAKSTYSNKKFLEEIFIHFTVRGV